MTFDEFLALVREVADLSLQGVQPDTQLRDSGLDSLGLVLVLLHAEEHGVPLPEELVESWSTVGDVFEQVGRWYDEERDAVQSDRDAGSSKVSGAAPELDDALAVLEVEGRHVVAVPLMPEHVPALHHLASTSRNSVSWWPRGRTVSLAEFEERLWHDAVLQMVVIDRTTRDLLGMVRIADYNERDGHAQLMVLGWPHVRSWLMEGVALTIFRAFTMWPIRKLYLMVPGYNDTLIRGRVSLLTKEGRFSEHEYFNGRYHDLLVYALRREPFMERWNRLQGAVADR